tara:strand:- start:441 stop:854 length:414 start_codon:yes stop_codon:yes gene_type:complete
MKELPYFKFHPNQWLTGSISFLNYEEQGAFIKVCCYYWSKECKIPYDQYTKIIACYKELIDKGVVKKKRNNISIDWLDEQYKERKESHNKRVKSGKKGGKQSWSNAQALRKDKIIKDKYANDNLLKVNDEVQKLLNQ